MHWFYYTQICNSKVHQIRGFITIDVLIILYYYIRLILYQFYVSTDHEKAKSIKARSAGAETFQNKLFHIKGFILLELEKDITRINKI